MPRERGEIRLREDSPDAVSPLRDRIEALDRDLVLLIAERVRLAREIGRLKEGAGLPFLDPGREAEVIRRAAVLAREVGMEAEEVRDIFWRIVGLCRRAQLPGGP